MSRVVLGICLAMTLLAGSTRAASQVDDLQNQVEDLRRQISKRSDLSAAPIGQADSLVESRFGPNAEVTTKSGKLTVGGLVQVWYQSVENDHQGITRSISNANVFGNTAFVDNNEVLDNDTYRIRRTELRFTMDVTENITGYMMMDPSRESNISFQPLPTFPAHNQPLLNPVFDQTGKGLLGANQASGGTFLLPSLLQDAYVNFHGVVPHHDFTIGQFKPPSGEEAWRNSGQLEFVERAMVTSINNVRDIGMMLHGTWFENRLQYWVGVFNGPSGTVLGNPDLLEGGNRSDDNHKKDIVERMAVRPLWNPEKTYGRLEVGYARTDGYRGESGNNYGDTSKVTNSLNSEKNAINRQAAWIWYRPSGLMKGWWLRGEWGSGYDRFSTAGSVGALATGLLGLGSGSDRFGGTVQLNPTPVTVQGWYFGTGYKLSDSIISEHLKNGSAFQHFINDLEFAFRYEVYQNIATEDPANPDRHTNLFKTQAYTTGLNYYMKGHDAKFQVNYIIVDDPNDKARGLRESRNNVFVINYQLMF